MGRQTRGLTNDETRLLEQEQNDDDGLPLDEDDLSEGDVVELTFGDGRRARYEVEGPWSEDETADLEAYDDPANEAEEMFPGTKAKRVWTLDPGMWEDVPNYRATLVLHAPSYTGAVVDNYPDDGATGYEVHSLRKAEVVGVEDRWTVEGDMSSPTARHVARVVREAIEEDPLVGTTSAESWTLKDEDHSGTGVLGNDLGPVVSVAEALDLHVREAFEEYLFENLNEGVSFECERNGVWSFYRN